MTLDQDEQLLVDALHRTTVTTPDLSVIALRAARSGTRLRHRHQARAAIATLAVVGVGVGGTAALAAGGHRDAPTATPFAGSSSSTAATVTSPSPTASGPSPQPAALDTSSAYAVLDAPGWTAPVDNLISDEKLYYVQDGTDASLSLNWRPGELGEKQTQLDSRYGGGTVLGTTTIDGDPANVFADHGMFTVVGPIKQGRFLTLSGSGVTLDQIMQLATLVHRQTPKHQANQPQ